MPSYRLSVPLLGYADPSTRMLEQAAQAQRVIRSLAGQPRRWVELDFTGIASVSWEFAREFIRLVECELQGAWLVPRRYDGQHAALVDALVGGLKRLRDGAWSEACERFMIGNAGLAPQGPLADVFRADPGDGPQEKR